MPLHSCPIPCRWCAGSKPSAFGPGRPSSIQYDGSWQVRLTAGHPSKRLNSIVPLDPSDHRDVEIRLEKAQRKFEAYGRPLVVRETPLAPPVLMTLLREPNWQAFEETIVMTCDLADVVLPDTLDHLPSHDVGRYVDASLLGRSVPIPR